ncbi:MAG: hypothetical protein ACI4PG_12435 [Candidatus Ventricola sp.]
MGCHEEGYPRVFLEAHEAEIAMRREAKRYHNEYSMKKIPSGQMLRAEIERLKAEKAQSCQAYRTAHDEMRELLVVRKNVEWILREDADRGTQRKRHEPNKPLRAIFGSDGQGELHPADSENASERPVFRIFVKPGGFFAIGARGEVKMMR